MLEIKELNLLKLKGKEKTAYKTLLPEKYRACLSGVDPLHVEGAELTGFGALWEGKPVGLAVGVSRSHGLPGELYSLFVDAACRHRGIGSQLMAQFDAWLVKKGAHKGKVTYQLNLPTSADFDRLLKKHAWQQANMVLVRTHFNGITFNPPWLHNEYPLPKGCTQFLWKDISEEDKKYLENLLEQGAIPQQVSPFSQEHKIDWHSSIGLRNEHGIIGWMVNQRASKDVLIFRSFFVFAEYYLLGHALRLLTQSIHLVQKKPPRHVILETYLNNIDNRWVKFVKNRLMPYAEDVERFCEAWKNF